VDLTLLFDLPPAVGLARARARNTERALEHEARFEHEELAFHESVRQGYLEIARREPDRVRLLEADRAPQEIFERVLPLILEQTGAEP
jgi:dTMP kinase